MIIPDGLDTSTKIGALSETPYRYSGSFVDKRYDNSPWRSQCIREGCFGCIDDDCVYVPGLGLNATRRQDTDTMKWLCDEATSQIAWHRMLSKSFPWSPKIWKSRLSCFIWKSLVRLVSGSSCSISSSCSVSPVVFYPWYLFPVVTCCVAAESSWTLFVIWGSSHDWFLPGQI